MSYQTKVSRIPQDEQVSRSVLVIQCMKRIAHNVTANCIRIGGFHEIIAIIEPLCSSEWNPVIEDLDRLNHKMKDIYYKLIPAIEKEEMRISGNLQVYTKQLSAKQDVYDESKLLKSMHEDRYKKFNKIPIISGVYKDKCLRAKAKAFSIQNDLCISKHIVVSCEADLSARKKLLLGLNNLLTVMVDAYGELEEACQNKHKKY